MLHLEGTPGGHLIQPQSPQEHSSQDCAWAAFVDVHSGRLHEVSWTTSSVLSHPHSRALPRVQVELPVYQFLPTAFWLGTSEQSLLHPLGSVPLDTHRH